jgi:hypothetical protein
MDHFPRQFGVEGKAPLKASQAGEKCRQRSQNATYAQPWIHAGNISSRTKAL